MRTTRISRRKATPRPPADKRRPSIGIRELKAKASAIIKDVKGRRITYAVTKRGEVDALIVPVDAGERLVGQSPADTAWDAWQALVVQLSKEPVANGSSAVVELERMRR